MSRVRGLPEFHRSFIMRDVKRETPNQKLTRRMLRSESEISFTFIGGMVVARIYTSRAAAISVLARQARQRESVHPLSRFEPRY